MIDEESRIEKIEQLKKGLNNQASLHISRVPIETFQSFISFADVEFCSDRGMALKHLFDCYRGLITKGTEHLEMQIETLNQRIAVLEADKPQEKKQVRKTLSGKEIG